MKVNLCLPLALFPTIFPITVTFSSYSFLVMAKKLQFLLPDCFNKFPVCSCVSHFDLDQAG